MSVEGRAGPSPAGSYAVVGSSYLAWPLSAIALGMALVCCRPPGEQAVSLPSAPSAPATPTIPVIQTGSITPSPSPAPEPSAPMPAPGRCPQGMAIIPAGTFVFGDAKKPTSVAELCMDVTEVTVSAYTACVDAGTCTTDGLTKYGPCNWGVAGHENHPINCLSWHQATKYCGSVGKRIPTEEEWVYAAYGTDGRAFPWGNEPPGRQLCWDGEGNDLGKGERSGKTCPVGSYPEGRSPFGPSDMAGNVWEWTSGKLGISRIIRGGGATTHVARWVGASFSTASFPTEGSNDIGVRCAK